MSTHLMTPGMISNLHVKMKTPLGEGFCQGHFDVKQGSERVTGVLVRLPVNDVTRPHLGKSNCLTPRAGRSALFVFTESELKAG